MNSLCAHTSGIAEPLGRPGSSPRAGIGGAVPNLFGEQPERAAHRHHRLEIGHHVLARGERVMAALAGQQRPAAALTGAVEGAAVGVFAIAVVVVAVPDRSARRLDLQQRVDRLERVDDVRVVGAAQSVAHQLQEVGRDLGAGRQAWVVRQVLDQHDFGRRAPAVHGVERNGADVVAGDAELAGERRVAHEGPVLDRGIPAIGEPQRESLGRACRERRCPRPGRRWRRPA